MASAPASTMHTATQPGASAEAQSENASSELDLSALPLAIRMRVLDLLGAPQRDAALADTHHVRLPRVTLAPVFDAEHAAAFTPASPLALSRVELEQLDARGYVVRDAVFGAETVAAVRAEAEALRARGVLRAAGLSRGSGFYKDAAVRSDEIVWLSALATHADAESGGEAVAATAVPALARVVRALDSLRLYLNACCAFASERTEVQLACYAGNGARYVRHLDAFEGGALRRLTVLYYLNDAWERAHGGTLRIYTRDEREGHVDIEPLADRVLIFQSRVLEHEVLPAHVPRYSLTVWFH